MWARHVARGHAVVTIAIATVLAACGASPGASDNGSQRSATTAASSTDANGSSGACDGTGVDAVLPQVGYVKTVTLSYATQTSGGFTSADTCPLSKLGGEVVPQVAIVVRNTSGQAAYLEASAECAPTDDAFLAVYAGATVAPSSDTGLMACSGRVANGCPSLTLANAGAVMLAPCDTAVLVLQGGASSSTRPMALDLDLATP
jgi:hypothetical protein